MTIKELEGRTGMTRANIRFYEGEGLLAPKRLDNGYRDYSEEDARTLEKIKLLRQIGLDIDTIRRVQNGALTLEQALFVQMTRLEGDKAVIERAAEVCRELELSGVEYGALDPRPWLRQLEAPPAPERVSLPPPPVPKPEWDDTPRACYHPWQRWLARLLDMSLYAAVLDALWLVLLRDQTVLSGGIVGWILELALLVFALAVESVWLHVWGWTPGKWVFGLKLRDGHGDKLTLSQGIRRSRAVLWEGYGLNIPLYGLWRFWKCREVSLEGRDCAWDGENDYRYTKEERRFSGWIFAGAQAVCIAVLALGLLYVRTPVNRGPLTVEEFAENYNYYHRFFNTDGEYAHQPTMDETGRWEAEDRDGGAIISSETFNGVPVRGSTVWDDPKFTVENGRVTAVTLRWESDHTYLFSSGWKETLALLALSGSVEGTDLFHYDLAGWVAAAEMFDPWGDSETDYRGLHISQHMESAGYYDDGTFLFAKDGEEQYCEKTVTISLIE